MKKSLGIFSFILLAATVANANIVCSGVTSSGQKGTVEIAPNAVRVSGGLLAKPHVFTDLTKMNGLITSQGLAITMRNAYGCMRNAVIITEFREPFNAGYMEVMRVPLCSGGSTPDSACGIRPNR